MAATKDVTVLPTVKITKSELAQIFQESYTRKINIKEVIVETKLDTASSLEQFLASANSLLDRKTADLENQYKKLFNSLQKSNVWSTIKAVSDRLTPANWYLHINNGELMASKKFGEPKKGLPVLYGMQAGSVYKYDSPVCHIEQIDVKLSSPHFSFVRLHVPQGNHPNVGSSGAACVGDLQNEPINFAEPVKLADKIISIEKMYFIIGLDSSYYQPGIPKTRVEDKTINKTWKI